ncbi:MAG: response regulator [Candidatus Melainabacteria bacterium]
MSARGKTKAVSVLIVEDHHLVSYGLRLALKEKGYGQIYEAANGQEALALVGSEPVDIVLMDINMPVMDGITATRLLKDRHPGIRVLMLTSHRDEDEVCASLASGADAYCMKDIQIDLLTDVMKMVMNGAVWLDPAIARMVMKSLPGYAGGRAAETPANTRSASRHREYGGAAERKRSAANTTAPKQYNAELTERELEVLGLLVDGKSNKEIAAALKITTHTAKSHVCNIIQKLAVDDRTQVAVKALKEGLLETARV